MQPSDQTGARNYLVACTGCGYSFWTTEDPSEWREHCAYGRWAVDGDALAVPAGGLLERPNFGPEMRAWLR